MCLLLRKTKFFRLILGIITMFILCLPEFFKIHEANTVIVSCVDTCSSNNTTFPLCTFNNSCKRSVQQRRENQTILLKATVNHPNFQHIPCICQSFGKEQQSHTKHTECEPKRDVNVDHQGSQSVDKKISDSHSCVVSEMTRMFHRGQHWPTSMEKSSATSTSFQMCHIHLQSIWKLFWDADSSQFCFPNIISNRGNRPSPEDKKCSSFPTASFSCYKIAVLTILVPKAKGSLEVKTEDVIYFYKYFNFTTVSEKEEADHNTYYELEIHINNSIVGRRNTAEEYLNHSCLVAMMEDQNDCINISLQLESYVEYPMCMAKIIWLTMIPVVFVFTISIVIYKIVQENEQNYRKHRVAAVSTILRRKSLGHARRTISATKIHPFPVLETSKQQIPLTAQTTKILPVIPEHEHCHVGASTVEDVAI